MTAHELIQVGGTVVLHCGCDGATVRLTGETPSHCPECGEPIVKPVVCPCGGRCLERPPVLLTGA